MINLLSISFAFFSIFSGWAQSVTQKEDEEFLRKSIFFGGGSYHIDDEQKENLSEFIQNVDNIENFEVIISGHTDNIGGKEFNEWLSEMRTHTVRTYLLKINVPEDIIHLKKFGQDNPLYNNQSFSGRSGNRRVDIFLIPITF